MNRTDEELLEKLEIVQENISQLNIKISDNHLEEHIKAGYQDLLERNLDLKKTIVSVLKRRKVLAG